MAYIYIYIYIYVCVWTYIIYIYIYIAIFKIKLMERYFCGDPGSFDGNALRDHFQLAGMFFQDECGQLRIRSDTKNCKKPNAAEYTYIFALPHLALCRYERGRGNECILQQREYSPTLIARSGHANQFEQCCTPCENSCCTHSNENMRECETTEN